MRITSSKPDFKQQDPVLKCGIEQDSISKLQISNIYSLVNYFELLGMRPQDRCYAPSLRN